MQIRVAVVAVVVLLGLYAPPAARAQEVDAQTRAAIELLMNLTNTKSLPQQMAGMASQQVVDGLKRTQPGLPEQANQIVRDVLNLEFAKMMDGEGGIHGDLVAIYAKHFTLDELKGMIAFYQTPVGRKAISELPMLAQETTAAAVRWSQANAGRIMGSIQDRLRAEGMVK